MNNTVLIIGDKAFIDELNGILLPLGLDIINETEAQKIEQICKRADVIVAVFDDDTFRTKEQNLHYKIIKILQNSKKDFIIVSSNTSPSSVCEAKNLGASDYITRPYNYREFIARLNAIIQRKRRLVCIGGGTGLFHILLGLKELPNILLTSIVNTSDDGGSSGRLRASFGILPPGDVRRSLVALSNAPEIMSQLMTYRFEKGEGITGHSLGNLLLAALTEIKGTLAEGVRTLSDILNIQGIVLPVTNHQATLCARFEDDTVIKGENKIDLCEGRSPDLHILQLWHEPEVECNVEAFSSILNSDIVIIGPGDLFTSVITNLLVRNIREAISRTKAKKVYICNLMTKPGETKNYTVFDHVKEVVEYIDGDYLNYVVISNTKLSDKAILEYAKKDQSPVVLKDTKQIRSITNAEIIISDVGHETELVRHDSAKVKNEINKIIERQTQPISATHIFR